MWRPWPWVLPGPWDSNCNPLPAAARVPSRAKLAGDPNTSLRRSIGDGCDRLQRPFFSANFCLSVGAFSFRLPVFQFFLIALQILIEHLLRHPSDDQPDH